MNTFLYSWWVLCDLVTFRRNGLSCRRFCPVRIGTRECSFLAGLCLVIYALFRFMLLIRNLGFLRIAFRWISRNWWIGCILVNRAFDRLCWINFSSRIYDSLLQLIIRLYLFMHPFIIITESNHTNYITEMRFNNLNQ